MSSSQLRQRATVHPSLKGYSPKELFRGNGTRKPAINPTNRSAFVPRGQAAVQNTSTLPTATNPSTPQLVLYCGKHNTPIHTCCEPSGPPSLSLEAPVVPVQLAVVYNGKYYLLPQSLPGPPVPLNVELPSVPQMVSIPQTLPDSRQSPLHIQTQMTSEPPAYSPPSFALPTRMTREPGSNPLNAHAPLFSPSGSQPAPESPPKKPKDGPASTSAPDTRASEVSQRSTGNKLKVNVVPVQTYEMLEKIQPQPPASGGSNWGTKSIWPLASPMRWEPPVLRTNAPTNAMNHPSFRSDNAQQPSKTLLESNRFGVDLPRETP